MSTSTFIYGFIHLFGMTFIMGGGLYSHLLVEPVAAKALEPPDAGKLESGIGKIWLPVAWLSQIAILVTGLLWTSKAGALNSNTLFNTTYGKLIVAKLVIIGSWFITGAIITAIVVQMNKMMAGDGPPPADRLHAAAGRIKMLSITNTVTGVVAIALAVAARLNA